MKKITQLTTALVLTASCWTVQATAQDLFVQEKALSEPLEGDGGLLCVCVDTGCMIQAAQLACAAMGLASVPRAWFDAKKLREAMGLDENFVPVMTLTVGFPA